MINIYLFILKCLSKIWETLKSGKANLLILALISLVAMFALYKHGNALEIEKEAYRTSLSVMLDSLHRYKVNDSINAVYVKELKLTVKEYRQYRADNELLLSKLKTDKVTSVTDIRLDKSDTLSLPLSPPVITVYKDTTREFTYADKWTMIHGILQGDSVQINMRNSEELIVTEGLELKKFLFIKLPPKIFGYKSRKLEVLSKNPNTTITGVEWVNFR